MSDEISIGSQIAGVAVTGGSGHTVHSGHLEVRNNPTNSISELRELLTDLEQLSVQHGTSPQVQASIAAAVDEAAKATPDTGRVRTLLNAVRTAVGKAGPVAQAALEIINVISGIEKIIH